MNCAKGEANDTKNNSDKKKLWKKKNYVPFISFLGKCQFHLAAKKNVILKMSLLFPSWKRHLTVVVWAPKGYEELCCLPPAGLSVWQPADLLGFSWHHNQLWGLQRMVQHVKNRQWAALGECEEKYIFLIFGGQDGRSSSRPRQQGSRKQLLWLTACPPFQQYNGPVS